MKQSEIKKWALKLLPIGLSILFFFYGDFITALPYFNEVTAFAIPLLGFNFINKTNTTKDQIRSGELMPIRDQNNNLNKFILFVMGALFIGYALFTISEEGFDLSMFNACMFGIILLIIGYIQVNSKLLGHNNSEITLSDSDFKIYPNDKSIEFSQFQLTVVQADEQIKQLSGIILKPEDAKNIKVWVESKLKGSNLKYYWKSNNNVSEM